MRIRHTRRVYIIIASQPFNLFVCLKAAQLSTFQLYILTNIQPWAWLCILLIYITILLICRNIKINISWAQYFLGYETTKKIEQRKFTIGILVWASLFCLYGKVIFLLIFSGLRNFQIAMNYLGKNTRFGGIRCNI